MISPDARFALLEPFWRAPWRAAVLTDFDGTLATIVNDPAAARPLPGAMATLQALARQLGRVGVVSGRPAAFLHDRLNLDGAMGERLMLIGLYGLERCVEGQLSDHPEALTWWPTVAAIADQADLERPEGLFVERKRFLVAFHFRTCPEHGEWARAFAERQATRWGLRLESGRMVYELRPPVDIDKGTVVTELASGFDAACFLGDDRGDLHAFAALDRLREAGVHTGKIAVHSPEVPPELLEAADLVVDGPRGALALLGDLLDGLHGRR
jgi:trehalose 6-phosphate phosphatase